MTARRDLRALHKALAAFTSLQHVQILRLQDEPDRVLLDYIRENYEGATEYVELKWTPACVHATRTIGQALLRGQSPFTRFSGPMMSLQSGLVLQKDPPDTVSALASRLTCLELHFDESFDLDHRMRQLSGLFKNVFTAATGMITVHIGFPSRAPLGLGLEEIFHHVHWERLRAFGIQAWRLDAEEIIEFVRRHQRTLRGLRLRDVLLKEPSTWKSILVMLRKEMECLDWVSLRRIGYARYFDQHIAGTVEIFPDPPGGLSESDDDEHGFAHLGGGSNENGDDGDDDGNGDHTGVGVGGQPDDDSVGSEDDDTDEDDNDDDNYGPAAHELSMDPDTPSSILWCNCNSTNRITTTTTTSTADTTTTTTMTTETTAVGVELGDDGREVPNWQRKMWEKWAVGRCPEHG